MRDEGIGVASRAVEQIRTWGGKKNRWTAYIKVNRAPETGLQRSSDKSIVSHNERTFMPIHSPTSMTPS